MYTFVMKSLTGAFLTLLASIGVAYGQSTPHPAESLPIPLSHFTESEFQRAAQLGADEAFRMTISSLDDKSTSKLTVLSGVESVDANAPDSRLALVTSYSYERNATIRRLVDLNTNTVVSESVTEDTSAPLAEIEKSLAQFLVLRDKRIVDLLGHDVVDVSVETLLTSAFDPDDRFFRKRVVLALLKTSRGYTSNLPKIFVDLTDSQVIFGE